MPRPTNFVSVVQKLVREQVEQAIHGLLGSATPKKEAKNGRRRPPAEAGEERMRGGAVVPRIRRLTPLATARPWAMPPHAVVGLACIVLAAAACTGTRDPAIREPANDANIRSLIGTWRSVTRDGTLSYRDHYRLEMKEKTQELSLIWVSETDDEKDGKFLKGDEKEVGRFKLNGRRLSGVRAWGADKWIKIYNGYVTEDLRQLQYQLQYSFLAGGCRDPAGNPCTDVERYRRMP